MRHDPSTVSAIRYRAFISYSHTDKAWGAWLHRALETYRVPRRLAGRQTEAETIPRRLTPIFRDRDELASAADLGGKVNEALRASANLIVVCSPHAAASRWVNEEVLAFKRMGRAARIFCLIVDGEPHAGDARECFAPALRVALDANGQPGTQPAEPVAADARRGRDGKRNALLKLIAGMLDVGFDDLKQREQRRRVRRLTAVAVLALLAMAVTTILAIGAVIARQQAEVARQAAERRQKQAEGLVSFMLGDLNDKLREVNRLDILQSVDDRAVAYFASLPVADVTDQSLAQRAKALQKIGSVRMDQGHLDKALQTFRLALAINRQRLQRKPHAADRLADVGGSLTWVGYARWYQGDIAAAQRNFQASLDALDKALRVDPGNPDTRLQLAYAQNNLGQTLLAQGDVQAARTAYDDELETFKQLAASDPKNVEYSTGLGNTYSALAHLDLTQGNLAKAVAYNAARQRIFAALAARDPDNHETIETLLISDAILGDALYLVGNEDGALRHIRNATDQAAKLVKFDRSHARWKSLWALYAIWQAQWQREAATAMHSRSNALAARRMLALLMTKSPDNVELRNRYAVAQLETALEDAQRGDNTDARKQAGAALVTLTKLLAKHPPDSGASRTACRAELLLARLSSSPMPHAERALALIQPQAQPSSDPRNLAPLVLALLATGNKAAAAPVIARLRRMGYRTPGFVHVLASHGIDYPPDQTFAASLAQSLHEPLPSFEPPAPAAAGAH